MTDPAAIGTADWSTSTEARGGKVLLTVMLAWDMTGGVREYHPYLDVELDETHALILFGELGLALQAIDARRPAND